MSPDDGLPTVPDADPDPDLVADSSYDAAIAATQVASVQAWLATDKGERDLAAFMESIH